MYNIQYGILILQCVHINVAELNILVQLVCIIYVNDFEIYLFALLYIYGQVGPWSKACKDGSTASIKYNIKI